MTDTDFRTRAFAARTKEARKRNSTKGGDNMMMDTFDRIKNLDLDTIDVDREVFYLATAKSALAEYSNFKAQPPEWLTLRVRQMERDIRSKQSAIDEKRLRELENRKAALLPRDQKIQNIDAEIADLRARINATQSGT